MAEVKLIDVVKLLKMRGHTIQYRVRNDGSIRITRLDGVSYIGSQGNAAARSIAGVTLSESRKRQLQDIKTEKGTFGHKRKSQLPEEIMKKVRRVQRIWKKNRVQRDGYIGKRGARYNIEKYGIEEAMRILNEQERYAVGLAYTEVINWIISYIDDNLIPKASLQDIQVLEDLKSLLRSKSAYVLEADVQPIHLALYDYAKGALSATNLYNQIKDLITFHETHGI